MLICLAVERTLLTILGIDDTTCCCFSSVPLRQSNWQKKKWCICTPLMLSDVTMGAELAVRHLWASSLSHLTQCPKKTLYVPYKNLEFCLQRGWRAWITTSEAAVGNWPFCFSWPVRQWSLHHRGHGRCWRVCTFRTFCSPHIWLTRRGVGVNDWWINQKQNTITNTYCCQITQITCLRERGFFVAVVVRGNSCTLSCWHWRNV